MRIVADIFKQTWRDVLDLLYPGSCSVCHAGPTGASVLCADCSAELDTLTAEPSCAHCAVPLPRAGSPCPWCKGRSFFPYERIVRLGVFKDPLKSLIHQVKYQQRWPLAEFLAERLFATEAVKGLLTHADAIVAVPLHWSRQISRGYNQAEVVASDLAGHGGLKLVRAIVRRKPTATQTHLHSRAKRRANLRDAFVLVDADSISGKHVVVVDDVMTTVATLQAVGRTLRQAKPLSLCAIVVAVAEPRART